MAEDFAKGVYDDLYKDCLPLANALIVFIKVKKVFFTYCAEISVPMLLK